MFGVQAYQAVAIHTQDPWELIDMLYAGAIRRIDEGNLAKAERIVEEGLLANVVAGTPLSQGFADSYDSALHFIRSNKPEVARKILVTLHDAWKGIRPLAKAA